jgi:hypothetical protein
MTPLIFGFAQAREIAINIELEARHMVEPQLSIKERLGRTLIHWGEQLATAPPSASVRPAA